MARQNNLFLLGAGLFLLTACSSSRFWNHGYIQSGPEFSSSRLSYTDPDRQNGIHLEIIKHYMNTYTGYLFVHSHPIQPYKHDIKKALISIRMTDKDEHQQLFSYIATRYEGGQRVRLPEEALHTLLEAFHQKKNVWIEASGYQTKICLEGFASQFTSFQTPPRFPKFIQSPF